MSPAFCATDRKIVLLICMKDVERGRRDHAAAHDHEAAGTPGRMTNVRDLGGAGSAGPYTTATLTGDRVPFSSDSPLAEPTLTPSAGLELAPVPAAAPAGPGLARVKDLYAPYAPGEGLRDPGLMTDIVRIVEKHPEEEAAIRAYMETRDGTDAPIALVKAREEEKRKKNGVRLEGGALNLGNPLLPTIGITVPFGVTHKRDTPEDKRIDDDKERDKRDALARGDEKPTTVVDTVNKMRNGPAEESADQKRNGKKLDDALQNERKRKAQLDD